MATTDFNCLLMSQRDFVHKERHSPLFTVLRCDLELPVGISCSGPLHSPGREISITSPVGRSRK